MTRPALVLLGVLGLASACSLNGSKEGERTSMTETSSRDVTVVVEPLPPPQPGVAEDPDDVTSPLDLESVSAVRTGDLLAASVTTYEPWKDDVLSGPRLDQPGPNRLTVLYDIDLDGRSDYTGKIIFAEGTLSVVIAGRGQAFEPVPVERADDATAQFVHPVDVFFIVAGQAEAESETDVQVAFESSVEGARDRAPDRGWIVVAFAP